MLRKFFFALLIIVSLGVGGSIALLYLAPERFTGLVLEASRYNAGLVRKEIALADGLRYVYLEGGQGEPLLLLHGFGASKDNFAQIAPYLTGRYHLIVPDQIGFGESDHPAQADYGPDAQAERLHALLKAIGISGPVHVGGNSMGGMIALHYGLRHPNETASLWLLDPGGMFSAPPTRFFKNAIYATKNPLLISNADDLVYLMSQAVTKAPFVPRPMLEVMAQERIANQALEEKIMGDLFKGETEKRVAGLATPALIVWGDQDRILDPAGAEILHKLLPNSKVVLMPGIGHVPMMEDAEQTAADFIAYQTQRAGKGKP